MYGKKSGLVGPKTPYGFRGYEEATARVKHQILMQDYEKLLKETAAMRNKLETAKKKKLILAAEVRFLGRRYKQLLETKNINSWAKQTNSCKQTGKMKDQLVSKNPHRLPLVPEINSKKKRSNSTKVASHDGLSTAGHAREKILYTGKEANRHRSTPISTLSSDLKHEGKLHSRKEAMLASMSPVLGNIHREIILAVKDATVRNSVTGFDLNMEMESNASWKEASTSSLASRTPIFDLNEVSTAEEDFPSNIIGAMRFDEAKRSIIRNGNNDLQTSDLKLSICRNTGEGSSRAGKRKISWQDPVALRV